MLIVLQRYKDERLKARKEDVGEVENEKFRIINKKRTHGERAVRELDVFLPSACGFIIVRLCFYHCAPVVCLRVWRDERKERRGATRRQ